MLWEPVRLTPKGTFRSGSLVGQAPKSTATFYLSWSFNLRGKYVSGDGCATTTQVKLCTIYKSL